MNRKPVTCGRCGTRWPYDLALDVPCPECHQPKGSPCKRPSGHGCECHHGRDAAAMAAGIYGPCPGHAPAAPAVGELDLFSNQGGDL